MSFINQGFVWAIAAFIAILSSAGIVNAAVVSEEDFESYSAGSLHGENGGTGWGGSWSNNNNDIEVVTSGAAQGSNAASLTDNSQWESHRDTASVSSGSASFYMRNDGAGYMTIDFQRGFTRYFRVLLDTTGNLSTGGAALHDMDAGEWIFVEVEFDNATEEVRVRGNGGAWSAMQPYDATPSGDINRIYLIGGDTGGATYTIEYDDIEINDEAIPEEEEPTVTGTSTAQDIDIAAVQTDLLFNGMCIFLASFGLMIFYFRRYD